MSTEFLNFILALALLIAVAKVSGYLSVRLGQPSVLGELLAGLILGPTLLDFFHTLPYLNRDEHLLASIKLIAELGVLLLMFLAGLQLELDELLRAGKVSVLAGSLGVAAPLMLGGGVARLLGASLTEALFIGLALSATSVSISAQTLMELGVLRSQVGLALLGSAVFDDVLVIVLLSVATVLVGQTPGGGGVIVWTLARMAVYLTVASVVGLWLLPPLARLVRRLPISQGTLAFALCLSLLYAWAAEVAGGMAAITGAFLAGLFLARLPFKEQIGAGVSALAYGFCVPIFFVDIGLEVNLGLLSGNAWWVALALTVVAIVSKVGGSGLGGWLGGLTRIEALRLGIGMVSRGEVGLIVAALALENGQLSGDSFATVIFMVIIATLVTPPLLRLAYAGRRHTLNAT